MAACGVNQNSGGDCEDCVQVVKTTKRVRVPCHRNTYKSYTVKVPRQVNEKVARTVNYTDYETRTKQVPYTAMRPEQRVRVENQNYQVPVQKCVTKMVSVTRKVPRTIYVDVTTQVPKQQSVTSMETRTRQVKIPYTVQVPETRYRSEQYQAPVQKSKVVYDNVCKTVYDTQVRTRCEPKVTYVTKEIPVYNVVARPAQPCPPGMPCGADGGAGAAVGGAAAGGAVVMGPNGGGMAVGGAAIGGAAVGGGMAGAGGAQMGGVAVMGPNGGGMAVGGGSMGGAVVGGGGYGGGMDGGMGGGSMGGMAVGGGAVGGGMAVGGGGGGMAVGGAAMGGMAVGGGGGYGSGGSGFNPGSGGAGQYQQEFNSIDTNGDGMISAQEYAAARQPPSGGGGGCAPQPPL